jgi:hypothetical protein
MADNIFSDLLTNKLSQGQQQIVILMKTLVYHADSDLFKLLDFHDDATFLEPLLFAYFNTPQPQVRLDQILYGYINDDLKPPSINVFADEAGIIYLPNVGYFQTEHRNRTLRLVFNPSENNYYLEVDKTPITYNFKRILRAKDTPIEICQFMPPLLDQLFRDPAGNNVEVDVESIIEKQIDNLNEAIRLIRTHYPPYFEYILKVTRKIVVYNGRYPYSFASLSAHGIAFLNADEKNDEVFFLEDLVHQCGHVIFSAVTWEKQDYLKVDPETPLSEYTLVDEDKTSIYGAFHGLFTQTNINQCLLSCYQANIFSGKQLHELLGRISDDMKRFKSAINLLGHKEIFTEQGWQLYSDFKRVFEELYQNNQSLINGFDTSNQPYIFNYNKFSTLNPLSEMENILTNVSHNCESPDLPGHQIH